MDSKQDHSTQSPHTSITAVVAIAASAGGLEALSQILSHLPADFPAPIVVVQHLAPQRPSLLAEILGRRTSLLVKQATAGARLEPGVVFIAPPNQHLLVKPDATLALSDSAQVHFSRPSADPLFESVATHFRARAIAVVLTGTGSDGTQGVRAIKQRGGVAIAQDPDTAAHFDMPKAAIATQEIDWVLPLDQIAAMLTRVVMTRTDESNRA